MKNILAASLFLLYKSKNITIFPKIIIQSLYTDNFQMHEGSLDRKVNNVILKLRPTQIRDFYMKLKRLNWKRILRQILPSIFFILLFVGYVAEGRGLIANLIAIGIASLVLGNIFLQNKILSRILGIMFLLGSCYMLLALFDDITDGRATFADGYWKALILFLFRVR